MLSPLSLPWSRPPLSLTWNTRVVSDWVPAPAFDTLPALHSILNTATGVSLFKVQLYIIPWLKTLLWFPPQAFIPSPDNDPQSPTNKSFRDFISYLEPLRSNHLASSLFLSLPGTCPPQCLCSSYIFYLKSSRSRPVW